MSTIAYLQTPECWILLTCIIGAAAALIWVGARWGAFPCSTLGVIMIAGVVIFSGPALAQSAQELVDQATKRARAARAGLAEWVATTPQGTDRYVTESRALVDGNATVLKRGLGMLDANEFPGAEKMGELQDPPRDGAIYVAVSFSMPPNDLRRLARDANRAGATLVVRGLVNGSFKETLTAAKKVFDETSPSGLAIDPGVFRTYQITQVPMFIAATKPVEPCGSGLDCVSPRPPSDQVSGNMSLEAALDLLSKRGDQAQQISSRALQKLRG
jgi:conjugal transfer pilus assembly protein TrbC